VIKERSHGLHPSPTLIQTSDSIKWKRRGKKGKFAEWWRAWVESSLRVHLCGAKRYCHVCISQSCLAYPFNSPY
jgi:hypothetical protein